MRTALLGWCLALCCSARAQEAPTQAPPARMEQTKHEVVPRNTLWDLSAYYYSNPWRWPKIFDANRDRVKNPHWIYPGQVLIIPGFEKPIVVGEPAPMPAQEAPPAPRKAEPPAKLSESFPEEPNMARLSERFPTGLVSGDSETDAILVPTNWKGDGEIVMRGDDETLTSTGDTFEFRARRAAPAPGTRMTVYRKGETRRSPKKGLLIYKIGVVKVISSKGSRVKAEVLNSSDSLQDGDWVKAE